MLLESRPVKPLPGIGDPYAQFRPSITGYVTHNTRINTGIDILNAGAIKRGFGTISLSYDVCFSVTYPSVMFIFREDVIREKYGGHIPEFLTRAGVYELPNAWYEEMELEVSSGPVMMSDCIAILDTIACCRMLGFGLKYQYKDVRDLDRSPWKKYIWERYYRGVNKWR